MRFSRERRIPLVAAFTETGTAPLTANTPPALPHSCNGGYRSPVPAKPPPHLVSAVSAFLLSVFILPACKDPDKPGPSESKTPALTAVDRPDQASHRKMVEALEQIRLATPATNRYLGDKRIHDLRAKAASEAANPSATPVAKRWETLRLLGVAELRYGNEREGIEALLKARALLPEARATIGQRWVNDTLFQLAIGYMRMAETENCCATNAPESCIVPFQPPAIHTRTEGSTAAIRYLTELLKEPTANKERRLAAVWLLNLAYMTLDAYPDQVPAPVRIPENTFSSAIDFPKFTNIAPSRELNTFNCSGGVVIDDLNRDGWLDIFTTTWETGGRPLLFVNKGNGRFEERGEAAGLAGIFGGLNTVQADYNNDGYLDIFILRGAWLSNNGRYPNSLLRNNGPDANGNLTFTDQTHAAGLANIHYPTQVGAWADYDNDGDVDLFIGNETTKQLTSPCQLFRNNGDGTFSDVAATAGVDVAVFCKGASWGDYNNDRWPDLYVSNYGGPNKLFHNNGDGTFTDVAETMGVTSPKTSFPVWFWDYNNDGRPDIFASSYTGRSGYHAGHALGIPLKIEYASLYQNTGSGFIDKAAEMGLHFPMLPMGANFGDVDGDGWLDCYLGTGDTRYESLLPNIMLTNPNGAGFKNVTMKGGFGHLQKGHGVAFADIDHDGDVDVFEQLGGAYRGDRFHDVLFENPGFGHSWIALELQGVVSNRAAIGARITVNCSDTTGQKRAIHRTVGSGGSFGANPLRQHIGLGDAKTVEFIEIFWPTSNSRQSIPSPAINQVHHITEG